MNDRLAYRIDRRPSTTIVHLDGVLGLETTGQLRNAVRKCLADEPAAVIINLRKLTVAEDIAVTIFPTLARAAAQWPGAEFFLCGASAAVRADLRRLGVLPRVRLLADCEEALTHAAGQKPPQRVARTLPPIPESCEAARRLVGEASHEWRVVELSDAAQLVATELVANAVRHAGTEIVLVLSLSRSYLHVTVRDQCPDPARLSPPDSDDGTGGRGLIVVGAVATAWGTIRRPDGKAVWATLRRVPTP